MLLIMLAGYVLLHDLLGGTLFAHSDWDSYTLQALAWRDGKLGLGQNYAWLELAVYNGDWYVSFPPVPTLVMLPLTFLFGGNTPNNLVMILYAMGIAVCAYFALKKTGVRESVAAAASLFYVWGCNMLWISTDGGVWFQAQALNMLLLSAALLCALYGRRAAAYALAALCVGCRPFSICAFLPLFVYFRSRDEDKTLWQSLRAQLPCLILPALIGGAYLAFNYVRFGNALEFGHNYLPEFTSAEHGQFSLVYLGENLKNLFFRPVTFSPDGRLHFTFFDGFMFYIANPLYLLLFLYALRQFFARRRGACAQRDGLRGTRLALFGAIAAELVMLCLHKTLGGWQFGARYTVDMLPMALAALLSYGPWRPRPYEWAVMALGMMFNAYGVLAIYLFT